MKFTITKTWDSSPVSHRGISLSLKPDDEGLLLEVEGPFFNDPSAPPGKRGKPYNQLWDFEVVEAFFLNSSKELYLEVELCPHGQHLVLLLAGKGRAWKSSLGIFQGFQLEFNYGKAVEAAPVRIVEICPWDQEVILPELLRISHNLLNRHLGNNITGKYSFWWAQANPTLT
ncbi:UPF0462 protein C4orf33 homolog isoform X3 [Chiloscyllium punctatum]|uniref:UPF0462 protein C4orf33 homolog isoform X3 n=1 Tax=Chiloscyllium punctatum TaxID=137246 RepID=UPI003B6385C9